MGFVSKMNLFVECNLVGQKIAPEWIYFRNLPNPYFFKEWAEWLLFYRLNVAYFIVCKQS